MGASIRQLLTARYALPPGVSATVRTVHAPHSPSAQPSFAPVSPRSRSRSSSVVWTPQSLTVILRPFRFSENDLLAALFVINPPPASLRSRCAARREPRVGD